MEGTIVASFNVFQYSREGSEVNPEKNSFQSASGCQVCKTYRDITPG